MVIPSKQRRVRRTVLVVCEGKTDLAFLHYLRSQMCADKPDAPKMTLRQAHGKGADNVASTLLGLARQAAYDKLVLMADGDIPLSESMRKKLRRHKVVLVIPAPCLEGLLLDIFGHSVPPMSSVCKNRLQQIAPGSLSDEPYLAHHWPMDLLHAKRPAIPALDALMGCFE